MLNFTAEYAAGGLVAAVPERFGGAGRHRLKTCPSAVMARIRLQAAAALKTRKSLS